MIIHSYGNPKDPAIVMFHPMLLPGKQLVEHMGKKIPGDYFLVAPDQAGHGDDPDMFFSPKKDAEELSRFLKEKGINEIELLYAASMGSITSMEFLKLDGFHIKHIHLDGTPLAKITGIQSVLSPLLYKMALRKTKKDPTYLTKTLEPIYGSELGNTMSKQMSMLSRKCLSQIMAGCNAGCAAVLKEEKCQNMIFEWGEKEFDLIKGKPLAEKMYPWARIIVRKGSDHCEFLGKQPEAYAQEIAKELVD